MTSHGGVYGVHSPGFTGGWHHSNYTSETIIERIDEICRMIRVKSVILGWNTDRDVYRKVNAHLHENGISAYLWLPVFSETGEIFEARKAVDILGHEPGSLALQEGENFEFYCPSDPKNIRNVFRIYQTGKKTPSIATLGWG